MPLRGLVARNMGIIYFFSPPQKGGWIAPPRAQMLALSYLSALWVRCTPPQLMQQTHSRVWQNVVGDGTHISAAEVPELLFGVTQIVKKNCTRAHLFSPNAIKHLHALLPKT